MFVYQDRFGTLTRESFERVTLSSLSPNDENRVLLVEGHHWIDRNFELRIQNLKQKGSTTIFRSPDEGKPVGSERIIWNNDGTKFALLGRDFISRKFPESFKNKKGELLYLVYDLNAKKLYCHWSDFPNYGCLPISVENMQEFSDL